MQKEQTRLTLESVLMPENINLNLDADSKEDVLFKMATMLKNSGCIKSIDDYLKAVYERELEGLTGIGEGIALPHGRSKAVLKTAIAIAKNNKEIDWPSMDELPVKYIILLAVKDQDISQHVVLLSDVAKSLCDEDVIRKLLNENDKKRTIEILKGEK